MHCREACVVSWASTLLRLVLCDSFSAALCINLAPPPSPPTISSPPFFTSTRCVCCERFPKKSRSFLSLSLSLYPCLLGRGVGETGVAQGPIFHALIANFPRGCERASEGGGVKKNLLWGEKSVGSREYFFFLFFSRARKFFFFLSLLPPSRSIPIYADFSLFLRFYFLRHALFPWTHDD